MDYKQLIDGMKRFGSNESDICLHAIGVPAEKIHERVLIAPSWEPPLLPDLGKAESISDSSQVKVWNISNEGLEMTYIKTGVGAPVLMDVVLSLGVTKCRQALFIGSVGSLDENIGIGDLVIPEYSICGDGASRYIAWDLLKTGDVFGEKSTPDEKLFSALWENTEKICSHNQVKCHVGRTFSIDTIFAQFVHIDEIVALGCNVIEMETAAAFRAALCSGIALAALFSVSDNTVTHKSLVSGRTENEMAYRRFIRKTVVPKIVLETFRSKQNG